MTRQATLAPPHVHHHITTAAAVVDNDITTSFVVANRASRDTAVSTDGLTVGIALSLSLFVNLHVLSVCPSSARRSTQSVPDER